MSGAPSPPRGGLAERFAPGPLPRWRAVLAVVLAAAALLAGGGALEFTTGSPSTVGTAVPAYWALFFLLHVIAFGGAALFAGLPALASDRIKLTWAAAVVALYIVNYTIWHRHHVEAGVIEWLSTSANYLAAAVTLLIGLRLNPLPPER